jgi:hypothetical protein
MAQFQCTPDVAGYKEVFHGHSPRLVTGYDLLQFHIYSFQPLVKRHPGGRGNPATGHMTQSEIDLFHNAITGNRGTRIYAYYSHDGLSSWSTVIGDLLLGTGLKAQGIR